MITGTSAAVGIVAINIAASSRSGFAGFEVVICDSPLFREYIPVVGLE
jgi:hypothetical protein